MQLIPSAGLVPTSARSLPRFKLYEPRSIAQALDALAAAASPVVLAGGTDLVARFNEGLSPGEMVSLAHVAELRSIAADGVTLRIGACVSHDAGCTNAIVREQIPGFSRAWARIANPRIRFNATLGGNLMALRPRYEGSLLLTAARAQLEFISQSGSVTMTPQDPWEGRVPARSLLTTITLDTADLLWYAYERSMRPLITLATGLRRRPDGLLLSCAVATEYLRPVLLELEMDTTDLPSIARNSREIAKNVFAQLPGTFSDPVATRAYCLAAGTTLLARQLAGVAHA